MARLARTMFAMMFGLVAVSCTPDRAVLASVTIDQFAFVVPPQSLIVGDTITWTNNDVVDHTATGVNNEFEVVIPSKQSVTMTLDTSGQIQFYCRFHPNMTGALTVASK